MAQEMMEIRWHARGGQGAKTAATLVAMVALEEGKYSQGFPEYGPERMGAPVKGYTRISDKPISVHCNIDEPDVEVVLDASLLDSLDLADGLNDDGVVIINTPLSPSDMRRRLATGKGTIWTVDATKIALEEIDRPIPNTPMMGALVKVTGVLKLQTLIEDLRKKFGKKFSQEVVEGNVRAVRRAHEEVVGE